MKSDSSTASAQRFQRARALAKGLDVAFPDRKLRRDENRARGACINENKAGTHGAATNGVRCASCAETHRRSA